MSYLALRHLHITCAVISISLFCLRGLLLLRGSQLPKILRWLPHLNDTVLLGAALGLAIWSGQYPLQQSWLTAKLLALVAYVLLGKQALRPGLSVRQRLPWLAAALLSVAYIVSVAVTRSALPFLAA